MINTDFIDQVNKMRFEAMRDWHARSMGLFCQESVFKKIPDFFGIETDPKNPPEEGTLLGIPIRISPFVPAGKLTLMLTHCRHCGRDFMTYGVCPQCGNQTEIKIISVSIE